MPSELLTLEEVRQFPTLILLCWAFTQYLKEPIDFFLQKRGGSIHTKYLSFLIGTILYVAVNGFMGTLTPEMFLLAPVNGLIISFTARKVHEESFEDGFIAGK